MINETDLQGGAGTNLNSTYTDANAASLDISNAEGKDWRIDVKRTDVTWSGDFILKVQRNTAPGYTTIGTTDTSFFTGSGNTNGVSLDYQLSGVSVGVEPDTYSSTITYTVVEI